MTKGRERTFWLIWALAFPLFLYFFIDRITMMSHDQTIALSAFALLIVIVSLFPIRIKNTSLIPLHGIALAVFLQFGLLIEMAVTQLALFTALLTLRLTKRELYRVPFNSLIFMVVSLSSAGVFYLLGGTTGSLERLTLMNEIIPTLGYALTFFVSNHVIIYLSMKYVASREGVSFWDEGLKWEAISAIMIIPVGLTLTVLYQQIGFVAILLMGIPFISVSLILRQYHNTETTNDLLKEVSAFGYQVNESLTVNGIISLFYKHVRAIFPADRIYLYDKIQGRLQVNPLCEEEGALPEGDGISMEVLRREASSHFDSRKQWLHIESRKNLPDTQSILSVPVMRNNSIVGVVTLTSERKKAFEKRHAMILEFMANYMAVAAQNARSYEKKKRESERCALTGLYNFRFFENLLVEKYDLQTTDCRQFAIILLDLDRFKRVNDTFGHHSGNVVLCQVADVLKKHVGDRGTVARYGGEEFVILIDNTDVSFAHSLAETLRTSLEVHRFKVENDLDEGRQAYIQVTASIGVAGKTNPDESAMGVLRNADRAMYTGAKQKGRNRVANFHSCEVTS
ncbi:hypothetical protein CR205_01620 [Alteribacter lacisalsi]|uniref:GGDEF domain-containing protein n=1 Tax=Alteribacter lacisalsi TaxID=2045244 RepID=A0A2W0HUJ7_9BACI|nr:sensor domain-containing diguanylate cyclase [Alteribacter lacisalsi]PYZ97328.1 hypothetical protein CR205_01620 [Alteribacter lacisalsi]